MRYDIGRRPVNAQSGMGVRFTPNQLAEMHGSPQYSTSPQQQQQQQQPLNSSQPQPQVWCSCVGTWMILYLILVSTCLTLPLRWAAHYRTTQHWGRHGFDPVHYGFLLCYLKHNICLVKKTYWYRGPHSCNISLSLCHIYWTHTRPFKGPLSGTTRVSRYQKGKTSLDSTETRDSEWQWHQLGYKQVCTSLQTDNHASTPPLSFFTKFFTGRMPFLSPNRQHQSTEGSIYCTEEVGYQLVGFCEPST